MSALRDTENKLDWAMLFEHFPLAMQELCKARMYGARHYTKDGKDGVTNWRESINGPEHDKFFKGCLRGSISHTFKRLWGQERDEPQDNVHHLAFSALNDLMALEYDLSKENAIDHLKYQEEDEYLDYYQTLPKRDGLSYFFIDELGFVYATEDDPKLDGKSYLYGKAPAHLCGEWEASLRRIEPDYAGEIDQLVNWDYHCSFWCFYKNGDVYISDNEPVIIEGETYHFNGYYSFLEDKIPEHLWRYWKESVRMKP